MTSVRFRLVDQPEAGGRHAAIWRARDVPLDVGLAGVYTHCVGHRIKKAARKAGLRREVNRKPPRGNKFWFKLAAFSFTVKVAIVIALFFVLRSVMG